MVGWLFLAGAGVGVAATVGTVAKVISTSGGGKGDDEKAKNSGAEVGVKVGCCWGGDCGGGRGGGCGGGPCRGGDVEVKSGLLCLLDASIMLAAYLQLVRWLRVRFCLFP